MNCAAARLLAGREDEEHRRRQNRDRAERADAGEALDRIDLEDLEEGGHAHGGQHQPQCEVLQLAHAHHPITATIIADGDLIQNCRHCKVTTAYNP